jgi:hypothetical protein
MLTITIPGKEFFDEATSRFIKTDGITIELEHSLAALSKWESKHEKPFLSGKEKTSDEFWSYIQMMVITPGVNSEILSGMTKANFDEINDYVNSKETATTFSMLPQRKGRSEIITAEVIYHWMVVYNIPESWEHRHLNQLFTMIRVCNAKNPNNKQNRLSAAERSAQMRELNARRLKELNTTG